MSGEARPPAVVNGRDLRTINTLLHGNGATDEDRLAMLCTLSLLDERHRFAGYVPLAPGAERSNGGQRCDTTVGPCSCGAWHKT